jgi:guanosine-3',5'-bis(diphosphate) 3'-pyrophosphohydrolase
MERKRLQVVHAPGLSYEARIIKFADKLNNCRDILHLPPAGWSMTRKQEYFQWCFDVVYQIRGANAALESALDAVFKEAEEKLDFQIESFDTIQQRKWAP